MKKILMIDDEAQSRELFLRYLTFQGFWAIGAENGLIGVQLAQTYSPNLVVCNIVLPDIDGYQVLSILRQEQRTTAIPLIFLAAKGSMVELRRGMELGADDYLFKPCTVERFLSAIAIRLERQAVLNQWYAENAQACALAPAPVSPPRSLLESSGFFPPCPKLTPVFRFIEAHYHEAISLTAVAQSVGYSPAYLTTLVQHQTGRTVKQWITERRMAQARLLLIETNHSIKQVAKALGYADAGYFIRQFRQCHGVSPQVWRTSPASLSVAG